MAEDLAFLKSYQGLLKVRVTPKASFNRIKAETGADGQVLVRVYVTCAPEDGKANKAVLALLAKGLGVPKSALTIVRGESARDKLIEIKR